MANASEDASNLSYLELPLIYGKRGLKYIRVTHADCQVAWAYRGTLAAIITEVIIFDESKIIYTTSRERYRRLQGAASRSFCHKQVG
jgi:hypothetical protein